MACLELMLEPKKVQALTEWSPVLVVDSMIMWPMIGSGPGTGGEQTELTTAEQ